MTVITRKAYGGAYDVMSSKHLRGDANFACVCVCAAACMHAYMALASTIAKHSHNMTPANKHDSG